MFFLFKKVLTQIREETGESLKNTSRRKKPKAPNPLSCKKKKTAESGKIMKKETESAPSRKRARKRKVKIASHAAASVNAKMKILLEN